ncbi:hypothetical protein [Sphingomonas oryzagri]|uniref:Scaffolding protein n=1 Tax=Sphingomonas oryzagri TaxID=3042314 RepID=A0ABT6N0W2_9SPHN|nr:hypothetical protein [Sphingomonas oryzagri]MDH7638950.1 hypothetical protein [Sphingomonas oryzagri]
MIDGENDDTDLHLDAPEGDDQDIQQPEGDADEIGLEIEGEDDPEDTPLVRRLRQEVADAKREAAAHRKATPAQKRELGPKPTLESMDYDEERFEAALTKWHEDKRAIDTEAAQAEEQTAVRNQAFERARVNYQAKAQTMKIANFETAERNVLDALGPEFLGAIIQYADDPAKLVGAIGNNPSVLSKVAAEQDPLSRFKMLFKVEQKIVVKGKKPPAPEADTILRSTAPVAAKADDKRETELWKKYEKSGSQADLDAFRAHRAEKRKAA